MDTNADIELKKTFFQRANVHTHLHSANPKRDPEVHYAQANVQMRKLPWL